MIGTLKSANQGKVLIKYLILNVDLYAVMLLCCGANFSSHSLFLTLTIQLASKIVLIMLFPVLLSCWGSQT